MTNTEIIFIQTYDPYPSRGYWKLSPVAKRKHIPYKQINKTLCTSKCKFTPKRVSIINGLR